MSWEGTVSCEFKAEFVFVVDETWQATDEDHAKRLVEQELVDYLGQAFNDRRFDEVWSVVPD